MKQPPKKSGRTIADLRATHDKSVFLPNRIRDALKALKESGDEWIYEADFLKLAKPPIGSQDIAKFRDHFQDFWAEMPSTNGKSQIRRVWFANKPTADEWRALTNG